MGKNLMDVRGERRRRVSRLFSSFCLLACWKPGTDIRRDLLLKLQLRATSHKRLRALDHYTSSTLIGGKGGAGPSSLHTTLEGPMEYVNARWMSSLHGFLSGIDWIVFHGRLDYFQKPPLGGRSNVKPGDHGTPNVHNR